MKDDINQIPLNMSYLWEYYVVPDECEDAGPTLLYYNMPETQEERSQMYQDLGESANFFMAERCVNYNYHPGGW